MKTRQTLNIISIIANVFASLVFMLPVWYFSYTTKVNSIESTSTTYTVNVFDYNRLNDINKIYNTYGQSININLSLAFLISAIITMALSLTFIILTLSTMIKRLPTYNKLSKICKIFSIIIPLCAFISLILAIIFSHSSKCTPFKIGETSHSLSINITTGIYLFTMFELAGGICGYIANNSKE